jgi:hypothetical protein
MNLYYKYYTADIVEDGELRGNMVIQVPFYKSAIEAFRIMRKSEYLFVNFRRVE